MLGPPPRDDEGDGRWKGLTKPFSILTFNRVRLWGNTAPQKGGKVSPGLWGHRPGARPFYGSAGEGGDDGDPGDVSIWGEVGDVNEMGNVACPNFGQDCARRGHVAFHSFNLIDISHITNRPFRGEDETQRGPSHHFGWRFAEHPLLDVCWIQRPGNMPPGTGVVSPNF
ncbi:hypothetical protein TNIN_469641 [Trichonephila inaurata madagascariensis]|uniref:Uncharacterized protein n=1 Tax=Trichonephila inaurata madagascariensis TaxID=2747483 RepID=A0A8X6XFG8_9ARAC|nr:hypothetical protein TNIN_469641 [Trichonephila inaurata madagascariensis]